MGTSRRTRNSAVLVVFLPGSREIAGIVGTFNPDAATLKTEQDRFASRGFRAEVRYLHSGAELRASLS